MNQKNDTYNRVTEENLIEKVIQIKRVSKKVKGGNTIAFTALVAVGDGGGQVGLALGKAKSVIDAINKAVRTAKKKMIKVAMKKKTIVHPIEHKKKAARILLKPAKEGTGLIVGGAVRSVAEAAGIEDLVAKILGSKNKSVNAWAAFEALKKIKT